MVAGLVIGAIYGFVVRPALKAGAALVGPYLPVTAFVLVVAGALQYAGVPVMGTTVDLLNTFVLDPLYWWAAGVFGWALSGFESWLQSILTDSFSFYSNR